MMSIILSNPYAKLGAVIAILLACAGLIAWGYALGADKQISICNAFKAQQQVAVDKDQAQRQAKSDADAEDLAKQLQDEIVKNTDLQGDIDDEKAKFSANCRVSAPGMRAGNNAVSASPR